MAQTVHQGLRSLYPEIKKRRMSSGAFSEVFHDPNHNDRVIKVTNDPAYMKYIRWCQKQVDNPFVPKVYDVKRIYVNWAGEDRWVHVISLEKLRHIPSNRVHKLCPTLHKNGAENLYTAEYTHPDALFFKDWKRLAKTTKDPHLKKLLKYITVVNAEIDLHEGNIMIRPSTKQYVFTDPLVTDL
jgi:hypothetical protein